MGVTSWEQKRTENSRLGCWVDRHHGQEFPGVRMKEQWKLGLVHQRPGERQPGVSWSRAGGRDERTPSPGSKGESGTKICKQHCLGEAGHGQCWDKVLVWLGVGSGQNVSGLWRNYGVLREKIHADVPGKDWDDQEICGIPKGGPPRLWAPFLPTGSLLVPIILITWTLIVF